MTRAVLACPGRGSYAAASLGSLQPDHPWVLRAEQLRAGYGLEPLLDLDRADRFDPGRHLQPIHASPLIFLVSMLDAEAAVVDHQVTAVMGNSLGWYTALAAAGALPFDDAFRLVQEIKPTRHKSRREQLEKALTVGIGVEIDAIPSLHVRERAGHRQLGQSLRILRTFFELIVDVGDALEHVGAELRQLLGEHDHARLGHADQPLADEVVDLVIGWARDGSGGGTSA